MKTCCSSPPPKTAPPPRPAEAQHAQPPTAIAPVIALAGNPNVGKSTLFNALTGARQHVGNWPGKTVERKEGIARIHDRDLTIVDLPGTYSLNAYSSEEIITRDFLVNEHPSLVIAVVDAANLERNLYLVVQVLELGVPLLLALNMADAAHKRGLRFDLPTLSERLGGVPVVETVGSRNQGVDALRERIHECLSRPAAPPQVAIDYGQPLEREIAALEKRIAADPILSRQFRPRWLALKLLENDEDLRARLESAGYQELIAAADQAAARVAEQSGEDPETLITDRRYTFIADVLRGVVQRTHDNGETLSDKIDRVAAHPFWGVPIFALAMWVVFQFTARVSAPFVDWIAAVLEGPLSDWTLALLDVLRLGHSWVASLLVEGVIAGVGGVVAFVPVLASLYLAMAILEDTGYMARSALVMDGVMRKIGLHGKSFLPLVVGFGCTVPAVYATRTLENETDRKLTGFLTPFISCGARLPVYVVFSAAFFGAHAGSFIFALYVLGIAVALGTGWLLKHTVYRHVPPQPLVLEMPPYRLPNWPNIARQVWTRTKSFLHNASTIILMSSVVIWLLLALPSRPGVGRVADVPPHDSVFGVVSRALAPLFKPAGFGAWEASGSLMTGFVAKEVVISTMSQLYVDEPSTDQAPLEAERPDLLADLGEIARSFGQATLLTFQEAVNIAPRTLSLLPGVHLPELNAFTPSEAEEADNTRTLELALQREFTQSAGSPARGELAAAAFNVFVLLYVPCTATVAAMRQEFGTRWTLTQMAYALGVAWLFAVLAYQGGLLLGVA